MSNLEDRPNPLAPEDGTEMDVLDRYSMLASYLSGRLRRDEVSDAAAETLLGAWAHDWWNREE